MNVAVLPSALRTLTELQRGLHTMQLRDEIVCFAVVQREKLEAEEKKVKGRGGGQDGRFVVWERKPVCRTSGKRNSGSALNK